MIDERYFKGGLIVRVLEELGQLIGRHLEINKLFIYDTWCMETLACYACIMETLACYARIMKTLAGYARIVTKFHK